MITVQDIYRFALFRRASFKLVDGGPYAVPLQGQRRR